MKTKPQRVTWATHEQLSVPMLASLGMSDRCIMERTGYTQSQVTYRLRQSGIKRRDYRDGSSTMARRVIDRVIPSRVSDIRSLLDLKLKEVKQ